MKKAGSEGAGAGASRSLCDEVEAKGAAGVNEGESLEKSRRRVRIPGLQRDTHPILCILRSYSVNKGERQGQVLNCVVIKRVPA